MTFSEISKYSDGIGKIFFSAIESKYLYLVLRRIRLGVRKPFELLRQSLRVFEAPSLNHNFFLILAYFLLIDVMSLDFWLLEALILTFFSEKAIMQKISCEV
jgi:hypothetical protein